MAGSLKIMVFLLHDLIITLYKYGMIVTTKILWVQRGPMGFILNYIAV